MSMGRLTKKRTGAFYLTNLLLTVVLFVVLYLLIDGKVLTGRYTTLITLVCVNVILAVSLNLVTGILGQLVLGHAGFMLVGAYASALFTKNVGMPPNKFRQNYIVSAGIEEKTKRKRK